MANDIKILDYQYDNKLKAFSVMAIMTIEKYLEISDIQGENQDIQRKVISTKKSKIYERLIDDLKKGCIIPPIVLAIKTSSSKEIEGEDVNRDDLFNVISGLTSDKVTILDGLQRTNCLQKVYETYDSNDDELNVFLNRTIRIEFWMNIKFQAILYRMITLNAGQTPMTMKHQLEILNLTMVQSIKDIRPDVKIITSKITTRRTCAKTYQFSNIIEGYSAYINKSPLIDSKNLVIEELNKIDFLEAYEKTKGELGLEIFIKSIADFDQNVTDRYNNIICGDKTINGYQLFTKPTFFIGFCAALGYAIDVLKLDKYNDKLSSLFSIIKNTEIDDPLELEIYYDLIESSTNKARIGEKERQLVFEAFKGYFFSFKFNEFKGLWSEAGKVVNF